MTMFGEIQSEVGRLAAWIGSLDREVEYYAGFPKAMHSSNVQMAVAFDYSEDDEVRIAWANKFVERYGGEIKITPPWEGARLRLTIKGMTESGLTWQIQLDLTAFEATTE